VLRPAFHNPSPLPRSSYWYVDKRSTAVSGQMEEEVAWEGSIKDTYSTYFPVFKVWGAAGIQNYTSFCVTTFNSGRRRVCSRTG